MPPGETHTRRSNDHHLNVEETLLVFFKGLPAVDVVMVVSFLVKKMRHNQHSASWTAIVYVMSFLLSFCMHVVGLSGSYCIQSVKWRGAIAYLSTLLRMFGAAALLLFLGYAVHSAALFAPFLLVLALVTVLSWWTFSSRQIGSNWGHFNKELKLLFDLSANAVYMAFAGLVGRVNGGSSTGSRPIRFMAVAPDYMLFYGVVLGLLNVLLCTVPAHFEFYERGEKVAKKYKPILNYVALLLVLLASVVAAQDMDILWMNVFFGLFVIIAILVIGFLWGKYGASVATMEEQCLPLRAYCPAAIANTWREQDADLSKYVLICYFTPLFAFVMNTHAKYSIQGASSTVVPMSWWFKFSLFWALCSILAYVVRIVVFAEMRDDNRDRDRWAAYCTTFAMYGTMAITPVCFGLAFKFGQLTTSTAP